MDRISTTSGTLLRRAGALSYKTLFGHNVDAYIVCRTHPTQLQNWLLHLTIIRYPRNYASELPCRSYCAVCSCFAATQNKMHPKPIRDYPEISIEHLGHTRLNPCTIHSDVHMCSQLSILEYPRMLCFSMTDLTTNMVLKCFTHFVPNIYRIYKA